jgi:uncharacterized protein
MRTLTLQIELKADSLKEDGSFVGVATTFGNIDKTGDRIEPSAFDGGLGTVPILFAHDPASPVGLGTLQKAGDGILLNGQLNLETVAGREAYSNVRKGIIKSLSIGFQLVKSAFEGSVRVIKQGIIREVSLVLFPANDRALVLSVKDSTCDCDCPECEAGDCENCSNDDCDDPNCEGSQQSAAKALLAYL